MRIKISVLAAFATVALVPSVDARAAVDPQTKSAIEEYCVTCHNARLKTGGLVLDVASLERVAADSATWEKVIRKLRLGVMPPLGSRRPDAARYDRMISSLEGGLGAAAVAH